MNKEHENGSNDCLFRRLGPRLFFIFILSINFYFLIFLDGIREAKERGKETMAGAQ